MKTHRNGDERESGSWRSRGVNMVKIHRIKFWRNSLNVSMFVYLSHGEISSLQDPYFLLLLYLEMPEATRQHDFNPYLTKMFLSFNIRLLNSLLLTTGEWRVSSAFILCINSSLYGLSELYMLPRESFITVHSTKLENQQQVQQNLIEKTIA